VPAVTGDPKAWVAPTDPATTASVAPAEPFHAADEAPAQAPAATGFTVPWIIILFIVWLAGALGLAAWDLRGHALFVQEIVRRRTAVDDPAIIKLLRECEQTVGITRAVSLWRHPELSVPILMGALRPGIILPSYELDAEQLRFVLLHELTHYRHCDNVIKWLLNAAVWMHWFNPLVHLMRREMEKASELACDEAMCRSFSWTDKQDYAITLLSLMKRSVGAPSVLAASIANDKRSLQHRLNSVLRERRRTPLTVALTAGLSVLLLCLALVLGCVRTVVTEDPAPPATANEPQVMYASPRVPAHIVIDAAHGGSDYGALYALSAVNPEAQPIYEKDYTLAIAQSLQQNLEASGAEVTMTRTADENVTPEERLAIINSAGADLCVSLHLQYHTAADENGSFSCYNGIALPKRFQKNPAEAAELLQAEMVRSLSTRDNEVSDYMDDVVFEQANIPLFYSVPAIIGSEEDMELIGQTRRFVDTAAGSLYIGLIRISQVAPVTIQDFAAQWSNAFHSRDANAIHSLCADEQLYLTLGHITDNGEYVMGLSSPWPWYNDHVMVINDDNRFDVYYYYRTSVPEIFVMKQTVKCEAINGVPLATDVTEQSFDAVGSLAEFEQAYGYGIPDYTSYAEAAGLRVGEANQEIYEIFCDPVNSAMWQLNIQKAAAEMQTTETGGTVTFSWPDGSATVHLTVYPNGVWIVNGTDILGAL
ncbi:MAG: M56 family metallopeptidase, partial [Syntrophomonadaceae bacterium]|nr:M56 family metallopeptidase [Syntrophomonadaceae bacterium]